MLPAILVLIFAWGLGIAIEETKAADFVVTSIGNSLNPKLLPFIVVSVFLKKESGISGN